MALAKDEARSLSGTVGLDSYQRKPEIIWEIVVIYPDFTVPLDTGICFSLSKRMTTTSLQHQSQYGRTRWHRLAIQSN